MGTGNVMRIRGVFQVLLLVTDNLNNIIRIRFNRTYVHTYVRMYVCA